MTTSRRVRDEGRDEDIAAPAREHRTARLTYQRLRMAGFSAVEAGNLTAHLNGLRVAEQGWTLDEIEGLLFVRALVELGRIEP